MSIRLQLLIVALTTLILPWAGCQYARELEDALRASQEKRREDKEKKAEKKRKQIAGMP